MYSFTKTLKIDAPPSEVWQKLSQLENIATWTHLIEKSLISSEKDAGLGAERTCILPNNTELIETVDEWETEKSLGYKIVGLSVARFHRESWHLTESGDATILILKLEYETNIPVIGGLLERTVFKSILSRDMTRLIAEFKYFVENGINAPSFDVLAINSVT